MARLRISNTLSRKLNSVNRSKRGRYMATTRRIARREATKAINRKIEKKQKWTSLTENTDLQTVSNRFSAYDPQLISNGASFDERIGNVITARGISVKAVLHNNSTDTPVYVRMAILRAYDQQQMTHNDEILLTSTGAPTAPSTFGTGISVIVNPFNRRLVSPIYQKTIKLSPNTGDKVHCTKIIHAYKKLNTKIHYDDQTNGGADNVRPRYHVVFMTGEAPCDESTGSNVEISGFIKFYYQDA